MITWKKSGPYLKNLKRRWFGKPILSKIIIASWRYILQILGLVKIRRMIDNLNDKKCVLTRPKLIYVNDKLNMIYVNNMLLMIYFNHNHAVVVEWHTYRPADRQTPFCWLPRWYTDPQRQEILFKNQGNKCVMRKWSHIYMVKNHEDAYWLKKLSLLTVECDHLLRHGKQKIWVKLASMLCPRVGGVL